MPKNTSKEIKQYDLTRTLHKLHKEGKEKSNFGLDDSSELIGEGFGLYSSTDMIKQIGPIKSQYFRISLIRQGQITFTVGLETFQATRNCIMFGFPGQIFSLYEPSEDFITYYMLFSEEFITSLLPDTLLKKFPFLTYSGTQFFQLSEGEASEIESIIFSMNDEVQQRKPDVETILKIYIHLILIKTNRSYANQLLQAPSHPSSETGEGTFHRFIKLVSNHYRTYRKVSEYAEMLHLSADHLTRIIRLHSGKTAGEFIDEMILIEAKAQLLHSKLTVSEIAYELKFSDPSHFNKYFKKHTGKTPVEFRKKS